MLSRFTRLPYFPHKHAHTGTRVLLLFFEVNAHSARGEKKSEPVANSSFQFAPCENNVTTVFFFFKPRDYSSLKEIRSDMSNLSRNQKELLELLKLAVNSRCADCAAPGKTCVCAVFIYLHCVILFFILNRTYALSRLRP